MTIGATPEERELAREALAIAHEEAKKPLVAVDIRTGNIGRQGVMWVETTTALTALESLISDRAKLREALEPFANMADANMNDPLSKWLRVGHIKDAETALSTTKGQIKKD